MRNGVKEAQRGKGRQEGECQGGRRGQIVIVRERKRGSKSERDLL